MLRYYLVPHDTFTNEALGFGKSDWETRSDLPSVKGAPREGYEVPLEEIRRVFRSRAKDRRLAFTALKETDGGFEVLTESEALGHKSTGRKSPEVARMTRALQALQSRTAR